jgi:hypothetical protein
MGYRDRLLKSGKINIGEIMTQSNPEERPPLSHEQVKQIQLDGYPMVDLFAELFMREGDAEMQRVIQQRGVSGALMLFLHELVPNFNGSSMALGYRCILFGYLLNEIVEKAVFTGNDIVSKTYKKDVSLDDLNSMWGTEIEE